MNPNNTQPPTIQPPVNPTSPTPPVPPAPNPTPTPPVYSQPSPQIPSLAQATTDQTKPGITLGIFALIFSVIMAPVGFVLSVIATIRGFSKKNTALGVMGAVGIPLSVIVGIIAIPVILVWVTLGGYSQTESHKVQTPQYTLEFERPAIMQPSAHNNDSSGAFYHYIDEDNQNGLFSGMIYTVQAVSSLASSGPSLMGGSDTYVPIPSKAQAMADLTKELGDSWERENLARSMGGEALKDIIIGNPTLSEGNIILMDASGTISGGSQSGSEQNKFKGKIGLAINDDMNALVAVFSFAEENIWELINEHASKPATTLRFN